MTSLEGKRVLITAGPTQEAIDPVRYISNHSSGKMGIAIAETLASQGAHVELVLGPCEANTENEAINIHPVISAEDMYQACNNLYPNMDIAILAAAVADYTPKYKSDVKIKKKTDDFTIEMVKTKDILKSLGEKKAHQLLVGFALETNNEIENAKTKLRNKNLDFIVLNSLQDKNAGFKHNTNKITIIDKNENLEEFELKSKKDVAVDIVNKIEELVS